jgi:hypothetical protein
MTGLTQIIELLRVPLVDRCRLSVVISQLQRSVWDKEVTYPSQAVAETLRTLAYDLDYFEPDPNVRAKDRALYGEERAFAEIRAALAELELMQNKPSDR